jgi:hypothetical protein
LPPDCVSNELADLSLPIHAGLTMAMAAEEGNPAPVRKSAREGHEGDEGREEKLT